MSLIESITQIVDSKSGGVKMTELVVKLLAPEYSLFNTDADSLIDSVEWAVHQSSHLDILDYVQLQEETSIFRAKQFVYRKIPE